MSKRMTKERKSSEFVTVLPVITTCFPWGELAKVILLVC